MFWAAVLLPLFACCDGTNSTPLEEADGSKSEPIKLFPNVPIVVRCELQEEVKKHWMNVIGTVTEEGELAADLAAQYEKIYEKLLAAQFKGDNMQQKVQKANKQSLCLKSMAPKLKI
uniref:Secreted protein n=1 Tax=Globodera pallida TaxID=36090 RepID=A0A183BT13_GLOPA